MSTTSSDRIARHVCGATAAGVAAGMLLASGATAAVLGPEWEECMGPDAGPLPGTAQLVYDAQFDGQFVQTICGRLDGVGGGASGPGDFQDMYLIYIEVPSLFSVDVQSSDFSLQLSLFDELGNGLLSSEESMAGAPFLPNAATDNTGVQITTPGFYFLSVTGRSAEAQSDLGDIFLFQDPFEVSGPDGPGGMLPIAGWDPAVGTEVGDYTLALSGVTYTIPAPGSIALLSMAGLLGTRRRRG